MKTLYQCDVCRTNYYSAADAMKCEAQGVPTNIKVGDIVKKHDGYGWHTGPDHWIMFDTGKFHEVSTRDFYWLVIEIKENVGSGSGHHCNEVICVSRGIVNGWSVDDAGDWGVQQFNHYLDRTYSSNWPVVAEDVPFKVRSEARMFMERGYVIGTDGKGNLKVTTKKG